MLVAAKTMSEGPSNSIFHIYCFVVLPYWVLPDGGGIVPRPLTTTDGIASSAYCRDLVNYQDSCPIFQNVEL